MRVHALGGANEKHASIKQAYDEVFGSSARKGANALESILNGDFLGDAPQNWLESHVGHLWTGVYKVPWPPKRG